MDIDWWKLAGTYIWTSRDVESLTSRANIWGSLVRRVETQYSLGPPAPIASIHAIQCAIAPTSHQPQGSIKLRSLPGPLHRYVCDIYGKQLQYSEAEYIFTHPGRIFVSVYYWQHKPRHTTQLSIASAVTILRSALWQGHPRCFRLAPGQKYGYCRVGQCSHLPPLKQLTNCNDLLAAPKSASYVI